MRPFRRRLATAVLTLSLGQLAIAATPALACGCGAVVTHGGHDVTVADETSLVRYRGDTEDIVMSLHMTGSPTSAAWFLPVPAKPTFDVADDDLFNTLADLTAPMVRQLPDSDDCDQGACAGAPAESPSPDVSVVQRVPVGPYDVATLSASDGHALSDWLDKHGFHLSPRLADGIKPYATQRWLFVAVRLDPARGETSLGNRLPPLRVTFHTQRLVYPMRLTALATHPQTVRLYVLATHRVRAYRAGPTDGDVRYAGWVTPAQAADGPLAPFVPEQMFLTRFDQVDLQPSRVTDDYYFVPTDDVVYRRVVTEHGDSDRSRATGAGVDDATGMAVLAVALVLVAVIGGGVALVLVAFRRSRPGG